MEALLKLGGHEGADADGGEDRHGLRLAEHRRHAHRVVPARRQQALELFEQIPNPDGRAYTTIIAGSLPPDGRVRSGA